MVVVVDFKSRCQLQGEDGYLSVLDFIAADPVLVDVPRSKIQVNGQFLENIQKSRASISQEIVNNINDHRSTFNMHSYVPSPFPPPFTSRNDDAAVDAARKRIRTDKPRRAISLPILEYWSQSKTPRSPSQHITEPIQGPSSSNSISLDSASLNTSDSSTDKYKWAVVYENQRGITLFSNPYYSQRSLLPFDPPPFTIPNASHSSKQANISLEDYPLPDGTWRWVSKCWMIDMRSDTGEVQHDGFEYNWMFRTHKWSAEVGSLSAGGWVRRRRWIRLMIRPAVLQIRADVISEGQSTFSVPIRTMWYHQSAASSLSHLTNILQHDVQHQILDTDLGWQREDVEGNWQKCCSLMKDLGRDGRKLELWKKWLLEGRSVEMNKDKVLHTELAGDITSDAADITTAKQLPPPSKEHLVPILRLHGDALLHSFIYPESRAKLVDMFREAGLLHVLETSGSGLSASAVDFWSYVDRKH